MADSIFGVQLSDYEVEGGNLSPFSGESTAGDLAELQKALSAGEITGRDTEGRTDVPGATLKVEDLENTLKNLTFKETDIRLWRRVSKLPAYNTVEEYNQQLEYGNDGYSFTDEGGLPEDDSPVYRRQSQLVKFMGTTRSVSHPMQLVNTHIGNLIDKEVKNGTLKLLRDVDRGLWFSDSDIIHQEFNGYRKQQIDSLGGVNDWNNSDVVIDLRGKTLTEAIFEMGALSIIQNHGEGNLFMCPPQVLASFRNGLLDQKKIYIGNGGEGNRPISGLATQQYLSQFGLVDLEFDKFMSQAQRSKKITANATSLKAPSKPVADATAPAALVASDGNASWTTDDAGTYFYAVSAINRFGESQLTSLTASALSVSANGAVNLKFTDGGGASAAQGYIIYRTLKDVAATDPTYYPIMHVSRKQLSEGYDGGDAGIIRDRNRTLPGTEEAFLIEASEDVWSFKQLAPLMKMDLAVLSPATRFMLLLYGTPILYAPKKMVTFKNIGVDNVQKVVL